MARRIRVSDESLNSYGFWVRTAGIDLGDFRKNPICLWNHHQCWRGSKDEVLPIGRWDDLKVENGDEMTAEPVFDTEDTFAAEIARKYENKFLNGASIGIQILEWSEAPELLKAGQTRPTVIKCRLREISIVDIPANKNAVAFYDRDGNQINLSDGNEAALDAMGLKLLNPKSPTDNKMEELKLIASSLGLALTANLADIQAKIAQLQGVSAENEGLKAKLQEYEKQGAETKKNLVKTLLDSAVSENQITAAQRPAYERLFEVDFDNTKAIVEGLPKLPKLSAHPAGSSSNDGKFTYNGKTFSELSKGSPKVLEDLMEKDFATFNQLYKSEYGRDYKKTER